MNYYLSASILSADFTRLGDQVHAAEHAGADWIHADVMDGHFVPNLTMGPLVVAACRRVTQLPLDVHLMVENPASLLEAFARAGASILTVHAEVCSDLPQTIKTIHSLGCKAGVVIKPATPVDLILPVLPLVDLVLVLSVNPGYSGQEFMPEVLPKVTQLRRELNAIRSPAMLEIDGGITPSTLPLALQAGANVFVSASSIFNHSGSIRENISRLRSLLHD